MVSLYRQLLIGVFLHLNKWFVVQFKIVFILKNQKHLVLHFCFLHLYYEMCIISLSSDELLKLKFSNVFIWIIMF